MQEMSENLRQIIPVYSYSVRLSFDPLLSVH
jgi:hypothetical protein